MPYAALDRVRLHDGIARARAELRPRRVTIP